MNPEPKTARPTESEAEEPNSSAEATPGSPADEVQYPFTPTPDRHGWRGYFPAVKKASSGNSAELELDETYESLLARFATTHAG
jgi:hypothetical protein